MTDMKFAFFIDYDNLPQTRKVSGILSLVTNALIQLPFELPAARGSCDVRIYGGWYEGPVMSHLAQDVSNAIKDEFPAIIRLPGDEVLTATAELAFALLEEPSHHLFNTYRKKGKPGNIRVKTPAIVGCPDIACPLPFMRKLLKTGKCPTHTCETDDLVYRHEQKIVDTMLTCDLIYATHLGYDYVVLISDDDDFLPPIRIALLHKAVVVRVHPQSSSWRAPFLMPDVQFFEMEI